MNQLEYEEYLQKLFVNVNDWLKFAEAKNFGLLSLNAAMVFGFSQTNFPDNSVIAKAGNYVFIPFAFLSFLIAVISLIPVMTKIENSGHKIRAMINKVSNFISAENLFENIHYYGFLRSLSQTDFETKLLAKLGETKPFTDYEKELSVQILYNSRITWLKFQFFKIGVALFSIGSICTVLVAIGLALLNHRAC